ncbi:MAG: hypothetical protein RLZZ347_650 [Candidatus Parcubacteria bacterium]|jgi:hypothetical protein
MYRASLEKWISSFLIGIIFLTSSLPFFAIPKAEAQTGVLVNDIPATVVATKTSTTSFFSSVQNTLTAFATGKSLLNDTILRRLANIIIDTMLRQMTSDIVQWINSGFQGSPAFATNPAGLLTDIADETIGQFIAGTDMGFLCSPFRLDIRIALAQSYQPYRRKSGCTLTGIANNVNGFIQGNNSGGWDNWLARTTQPQNNPYTSFLMAQNEVAIRIAGQKEIKLAQLNWGNGFLSWEDCQDTPETQDVIDAAQLENGNVAPGTAAYASTQAQIKASQTCTTKTPGKVISDQLGWAMSSDIRRTELAKDIDQIVNALVGQMVKQALGGIGGLLGASKPQSGSGRSFLNTYNYNNIDALRLQQGGQAELNNRINASSTEFLTQQNQQQANISQQNQTASQASGGTIGIDGLNTTERNLAQGKLALQSSIYNGYRPDLAVDGNLATIPSSYPNMSITNNEYQPWWQVDLGKNYAITNIIISPRGDGYDPLTNFHLFTSPDPFASNLNPVLQATYPIFKSPLQNPPAPYTNTITIPVNGNGRYVRIQAVDTRSLDIGEVRVFGADIASGAGGVTNPNGSTDTTELPLAVYLNPATTQGISFGRDGLFSSSFRVTGNKNAPGLKVETNLYLISGSSKSPTPFSSVFSQFQTRFKNNGVNTTTSVPLTTSQYIVTPSSDLSSDYEFSVTYTGNALPVCTPYGRYNTCPYVVGGTYQLETLIKDTDGTILSRQVTEFTFNP